MIRFKCGGCGKQYNVPSETAGKQARCKECGVMFHVPVPKSAAAAQSADTPLLARAPLATALNPADSPRPVARIVRSAGPGTMVARADPTLVAGLDAFDPYESSPLDDTFGVGYRPRKKSNLGLWVLLGGGGIGVVGMIAAAIMLIINNLPARTAGGSGTAAQAWTGRAFASTPSTPPAMSGDAGVYMPANWSICMSLRVQQFIDRSAVVPTLKQQIDQALAAPQFAGLDARKLDEIIYLQDGQIVYVAMTFTNGAELSRLLKADRPMETYRGVQVYQGTTGTTAHLQTATLTGTRMPENIYSFQATDKLVVGVTDLGRLKASIDVALSGGGREFAFTRQRMLNFQLKDVKQVQGAITPRANLQTDGIVGYTLGADLNNQLDLAAVLDMKDAQAASNFQSQVTLAITMAKSQLGSEFAPVLDTIQLSASGNQVHFTGSIPYHLLTKLMQPGQTPLAMPGMPWPQRPMPGQAASGQVPGFTPPPMGGGFQPPYGGSGPFPGAPPGLTGPGLSGRRPGGMRPPTIQPPRVRPPTSRPPRVQPPRIQPPVRPPRMRPPGRFR